MDVLNLLSVALLVTSAAGPLAYLGLRVTEALQRQ
jgi:hypothetical protein